MTLDSPYLNLLKNRINLRQIPFSERASRLMVFQSDHHFTIKLAERWFKLQGQLAAYRERPPLIDRWMTYRWRRQSPRNQRDHLPAPAGLRHAVGNF